MNMRAANRFLDGSAHLRSRCMSEGNTKRPYTHGSTICKGSSFEGKVRWLASHTIIDVFRNKLANLHRCARAKTRWTAGVKKKLSILACHEWTI